MKTNRIILIMTYGLILTMSWIIARGIDDIVAQLDHIQSILEQ